MRLQSSSGGIAIGDADNRYLRLAGGTLTGNLALSGARQSTQAPAGTIPMGGDPESGQTLEHTWNSAGHNWTALKVNVINTASGSASNLIDLQVGGVNQFRVTKDGVAYAAAAAVNNYYDAGGYLRVSSDATYGGFCGGGNAARVRFAPGGYTGFDCGLERQGAGVIEFTNGTAGTLRDWKARRGTLTEYAAIQPASEPASPGTGLLLFCIDSGGKMVLKVKSPSGDVGVLYTEP